MVTYKYKRATSKQHAITEIYLNGELVGYLMPLYNKPEYKYSAIGDNQWYVNINNGKYFLIEKRKTKKEIIELVEKYFQDNA